MLRWPFGARQRPTGGCRKPTVPCGKLKLSTFAEFWFPHATVAFWDPPKGDSGGPERPPYQAETQSSPPRSQRPWRRRRPVDTSYAEKTRKIIQKFLQNLDTNRGKYFGGRGVEKNERAFEFREDSKQLIASCFPTKRPRGAGIGRIAPFLGMAANARILRILYYIKPGARWRWRALARASFLYYIILYKINQLLSPFEEELSHKSCFYK